MKPIPGHTVQYASQRNRDATFTLAVECSCGRVFAQRIVNEDTPDQRAFVWLHAADLVGDHLSKLKPAAEGNPS